MSLSTYTRLVDSVEAEEEAPVEYFISEEVDRVIVRFFLIMFVLGVFYMGGQVIRALI